jgi:hypothetical protein
VAMYSSVSLGAIMRGQGGEQEVRRGWVALETVSDLLVDSEESQVVVATLVQSSRPHVQGPYQSGGMVEMSEMLEGVGKVRKYAIFIANIFFCFLAHTTTHSALLHCSIGTFSLIFTLHSGVLLN